MNDVLRRVLARAVHPLGGKCTLRPARTSGWYMVEVFSLPLQRPYIYGARQLADALDLALEHGADPQRVADVREALGA